MDNTNKIKVQKKKYIQKYRKVWENHDDFKGNYFTNFFLIIYSILEKL